MEVDQGGWELAERVLQEEWLLARVLGAFCVKERHRAAPLVCRRWAQLAASPLLLRSVSLQLDCTRPTVLPSFCAWLARWGPGHVASLHLELRAEGLVHALRGEADAELLFATLRACAGGGGLNSPPGSSSSAVSPPSGGANSSPSSRTSGRPAGSRPLRLQELRLAVDSQLAVCPATLGSLGASLSSLRLAATSKSHESASTALYAFGLECLSRLERLSLRGSAVELHRSELPPSLTHLHLAGFRDLTAAMRHSLPQQITALSRLHSLHLRGVFCNTPHCYRPLLSLPALERLALTRCTHLPACLPRLATLKVLCLDSAPLDDASRARELGAALAALTQLTHLVLRGMDFAPPHLGPQPALPPEVSLPLSRLSHLRAFFWTRGRHAGWLGSPSLPTAGPWLANLRGLALEADVAAAWPLCALGSSEGPCLERLVLLDCTGNTARRAGDLWQALPGWAEGRPALTRLAFAPPDASGAGTARQAVAGGMGQGAPSWPPMSPGLHQGLAVEHGCGLLRELGCLGLEGPLEEADFELA